ncbi:regulatory protein RecX [Herbiconiux sp. VKM Ac-2851]|uniref:regulatory protein RecX n=1 Tax=Herbiconiux sp. VKM Ac-2851 TaxID=2739025 RepID=UPI0015653ED4|nr:RecX family transcriptional regulator [Herbiconiux sp. VKM Ac-2851]
MNDIVSLDAARRDRQKRPAGASGSGAGSGAGHPAFGRSGGSGSGGSAPSRSGASQPSRAASSAFDGDDDEFDDEPQLSDEERLARVSDTVVRALGRRQLSAGETQALLEAQGASSEEAEELVARYEELGYLNDAALAEALVERMSERDHKSRGAISRELSARKIPSELVTAALEGLDDDHEFSLALDAATKRVSQLSAYDDTTVERRLMGFLTRRGFNSTIVREATRRAMSTRKRFGGPRFR